MRTLLLALLLLAPTVVALDVAPHEVEVVVEVAVAEDGSVLLDLVAEADGEGLPEGANVTVQVVVTHEDPLLETVVDTVLEVDLTVGANVTVALDGLRTDVDLDVHVLDDDVELPQLPELERVVNGTELGRILDGAPKLPKVRLPRLDPLLDDLGASARGWKVGSTNDVGQMLASHKGHVVASWHAIGLQDDGGCCTRTLLAAVSHDGGRTWTEPRTIAEEASDEEHLMSWSVYEDGRDVVFVSTSTLEGMREVDELPAPKVARMDPRTGSVRDRDDLRVEGTEAYDTQIVTAGGRTLLALRGVRDASGNVPRPQAITVFELDDGKLEKVVDLDPGTPVSGIDAAPFRMAVSPTGVVAVVSAHQPYGADATPWTAVSLDGGRTWTRPRVLDDLMEEVEDDTKAKDVKMHHPLTPVDLAVDVFGTVHATFVGKAKGEDEDLVRGWYVRAPALEDEKVHELAPMLPAKARADEERVVKPQVTVRDGRVWVFWSMRSGGSAATFGAESVDDGRTFRAPHRIAVDDAHELELQDVALLPDGRPVLLALANPDLLAVPLFDAVHTASASVAKTEAYSASPGAAAARPAFVLTAPDEPAPAGPLEVGSTVAVRLDPAGLDMQRTGPTWTNVTVENLLERARRGLVVRFEGLPQQVHVSPSASVRFDLPPTANRTFAFRFDADGAPAWDARAATVTVTEGDRVVSDRVEFLLDTDALRRDGLIGRGVDPDLPPLHQDLGEQPAARASDEELAAREGTRTVPGLGAGAAVALALVALRRRLGP